MLYFIMTNFRVMLDTYYLYIKKWGSHVRYEYETQQSGGMNDTLVAVAVIRLFYIFYDDQTRD